jgi:hypothetical protein
MPNVDPQESLAIARSLTRLTQKYYRHYKGGLYQVRYIALGANDQSYQVVYRSLDGNVYVREYADFHAVVPLEDGGAFVRFMPLVGEASIVPRLKFFLAYIFN